MNNDDTLIRLVDVGALGGLNKKWRSHFNRLWPILFEPNPTEAERLRASAKPYPRATVIDLALASSSGERILHVAKNPTCSSLLQPNFQFLRQYGIHVHFEMIGAETVKCARYDELFQAGTVPVPDIVKIDAQGFEYEILLGFGSLLNEVLGIELESHFYPIYQHQKSISDLVKLLDAYGFVLRKIDSNKFANFEGDLVEIDAYFTKRQSIARRMNPIQKEKFALMISTWGISSY